MKRLLPILWFLAVSGLMAKPEYPAMGPDIFDPKAPAETLIAKAVEQAARGNKRVLLFFGANWCPWCRQLHAAMMKPAVQDRIKNGFVVVYIDANTRNDKNRNTAVMEKYGNPGRQLGLPVFVFLNPDGSLLAIKETASLGANTHEGVTQRLATLLDNFSAR